MNTAVMFSKASDAWRTPRDLFESLDAEFGFDVDVAATADNCWKENYLGPDCGRPDRTDALATAWAVMGPVCWMNPPYSQCRDFMRKAAAEAQRGATVVCLVPSRTDTRWWHAYVWSDNAPRPGVEVRFLRGRLKFGDSENSAPFPSVVVIFRPVS